MKRRGIIIASFVGLALAIGETVLLPVTLETTFDTAGLSLVVAILSIIVAAIAGRVIIGIRPVHRYYRAAVLILSGVAGIAFESALSNWLISQQVHFGPPPTTLRPAVIIAIVIGAVAYLAAATLYGFAGQSQGVKVGARTGLLVVLLFAVVPAANVLGLIGFVVVAFRRQPASATAPTPEQPAASA